MMMIGHPSLAQLRAFALDGDDNRARGRVARHLERCTACRARVQWIRETVTAAREPVPPPDSFAAIAARITAGERVLLPAAAAPAAATSSARTRLRVAAAVFVTLVAGAVIVGVPHAGAEKSELWVTPPAPRSGQSVALEYRATVRLADEDRLVVRARYRTPGQGSEPRTVTLGELRRAGEARFTGTITLPDSAVYVVLAVEDVAGGIVDDHGERWEILVHDDAGQPLFEALRQRMTDALRRNTRLAAETMRTMVAVFPDEPAGWYFLYGEDLRSVPSSAADSVRAVYLANFARLEAAVRARGEPDAEQLWYLVMHARALRDDERRDRLTAELIRRFPTDGGALQQASWLAADRHRGAVDGYLAALDSIWALAPEAAVQAAFDGLQTARRLGSPELILKWIERAEIARPQWAAGNGLTLIEHASTRHAGMQRLRAGIAERERGSGERPLARSVADHDIEEARIAGMYYAALGRALLAEGRPTAALDTLDRALLTGWNTPLFRAVGSARLELGDTAGALHAFARLAADPNTAASVADSLRHALGPAADDAAWHEHIERARDEMRAELFERSSDRPPLRSLLRLRGLDGTARDFRLDDGRLTVVAFWSRFCPPSAFDLRALDTAARRLGEHGVRFIAISDESDRGAVAAYLNREGYTLPTYVDPERDAHNAFDNRGTPYYVVLDERGRIRFTSHTAAEVVRHVAVLGGPWQRSVD